MFIGHWAPALAAASNRKAPSLPVLFVAAQLVDWAFFAFLLTGWEHMRITPGISATNPMDLYDMPYTHSLLGSAGFALGFGALVWGMTRSRGAALIAGAVVLSHWFLDLLVHVPDLTLAGSPPKLGFGLWNHPAIEWPFELAITFAALWFYARTTGAARGRVLTLGALMLALQLFNWLAPAASEVTLGTSLLTFFAYGITTLAAWWVGKSASGARQAL